MDSRRLRVFANADALDWIDGLGEATDAAVLRRAFEGIPEDRGRPCDARPAACALAAAEAVAAALGRPAPSLPDGLARWLRARPALTPALVEEARRAVRRILAGSALGDAASASGGGAAWTAGLQDLLERLSSPPAGPTARSASRGGDRRGASGRPRPSRAARRPQAATAATGGAELRERARRFLATIVPFPGYTSETLTEDLIRRYVAGGAWDEPTLQGDLRLCYSAVLSEIVGDDFDDRPAAQRVYLSGCQEILRAIIAEVYGDADPGDDD